MSNLWFITSGCTIKTAKFWGHSPFSSVFAVSPLFAISTSKATLSFQQINRRSIPPPPRAPRALFSLYNRVSSGRAKGSLLCSRAFCLSLVGVLNQWGHLNRHTGSGKGVNGLWGTLPVNFSWSSAEDRCGAVKGNHEDTNSQTPMQFYRSVNDNVATTWRQKYSGAYIWQWDRWSSE